MALSYEKDAVLYELGERLNVAQFVSYGPGESPVFRFSRIRGAGDLRGARPLTAIRLLMESAPEHCVNIRTFRQGQTKGGEFIYGLTASEEVLQKLIEFTSSGWYAIVNETIDVNDGGVSGVMLGNVMEFAPGDTPRCVEKPGVCRLSLTLGTAVLKLVYGFAPEYAETSGKRVEFSIHPIRRGFRHEHTVVWEVEEAANVPTPSLPFWPNHFSQILGDKVFGLLIAFTCGCQVPRTLVVSRTVAPFVFGSSTGTYEMWQRTAPRIQLPGQLPTKFGWSDPFELYEEMQQQGGADQCASLLSQEGVDPAFSGAAACTTDGGWLVEGVKGSGVDFMLGIKGPEDLPDAVIFDVQRALEKLMDSCGPVRVEWAHDGSHVWVLQLHVGSITNDRNVICDGNAEQWIEFSVGNGLESLRALVQMIEGKNIGVRVIGDVGITSHFGDLLRSKAIPSILVRE